MTKRRDGQRARNTKIKNEGLTKPEDKVEIYRVMSIYSKRAGFSKPTCSCCGFDDWKFLIFGHTTRKKPKSHEGKSGIKLARKLKEEEMRVKMLERFVTNRNTKNVALGRD